MIFFFENLSLLPETRVPKEHFKLVFGSGNSDLAKIRPLKNWHSPDFLSGFALWNFASGAHQRGAHMPNWVRMAVHAVVPGCASYNYTSNKSTSVVFFRVFSAAQPRSVVVRAGHGRWAHGGTSKPQPCGHNGKNRGLGSGAPMPQAWPL